MVPPTSRSVTRFAKSQPTRLNLEPQHQAWSHVWIPLWVATSDGQDRIALRELAIHWLKEASQHQAWTHVWFPLAVATSNGQDRIALRELAIHWLSKLLEHLSGGTSGSHSGQLPRRAGSQRASRTRNPLAEQTPRASSWHVRLGATLGSGRRRVGPSRASRPGEATGSSRHLSTSCGSTYGNHSGKRPRRSTIGMRSRILAIHWLNQQTPEHPSWSTSGIYSWEAAPDQQDRNALRDLAIHWLPATPPAPLLAVVWEPLWEAADELMQGRNALRENSQIHWLKQAPQHQSWTHV